MNEVEKLLRDKKIYFMASGQDFVTKCFNPDHEDSNPSFRIDKNKGIGHCFACGHKINIFKHFGIISNFTNVKIANLKDKLKACRVGKDGIPMLECPSMFTQKFRGISAATFRDFEAFTTDVDKDMEDRLIFPVKDVAGKIRMFIGRHTLSDANPKYIIRPASAKLLMFPSSLKERSKYLVLVEGTFDMLNLYDKGLKAVSATMGTNGLKSETALKMLPFRAQGVTHVIIAYDGDKAGRDAAEYLKPQLEKLNFIVDIAQFPDDVDPGSLDQENVDSLREYCEDFADTTAITNKENDDNSSNY